MAKPRKILQNRVYDLPHDFPVLLLDGDKWYISDVKSNIMHFHNCLEIGICHENSGTLIFENSEQHFEAGMVSCIPKHIPHTTVSTLGKPSLWSYIYVELSELLHGKQLERDLTVPAFFTAEDHSNAYQIILLILDELRGQRSNYTASVRGLFTAFGCELERFSLERQSDKYETQNTRFNIAAILEKMQTEYQTKLSIKEFADSCNLSEPHFRRVFLSVMGVSPLRYINNLRIQRACELLLSTDDTVLSIAETVGFPSISCFNRFFHQVMGVSPREYRYPEKREGTKPDHKRIEQYSGWTKPEKL